MAWSTERKNRARDRAARLGAVEAAVGAVWAELVAVGVRVRGLWFEGLREASEGFRELFGRTWFKVLLTVAFFGFLIGGVSAIENWNL